MVFNNNPLNADRLAGARREKMKFSIQIIFLVLMVALSSCVPSSSGGKRTKKSDSSSSSGGVVGTPAPPVFNSDEDLFWFSDQKVTGTITINQNTQTVIYLRGDILHQFLENDSNFTKAFCMVVSYTDATVKKHLRARAVPIAFTNFSTQSLERLLRIDIPEGNLTIGDAYKLLPFANTLVEMVLFVIKMNHIF